MLTSNMLSVSCCMATKGDICGCEENLCMHMIRSNQETNKIVKCNNDEIIQKNCLSKETTVVCMIDKKQLFVI